MKYKETVSKLMAHSNDLHMESGDTIVDEMLIMRNSVLPYMTSDYVYKLWFQACATLFRCASKYLTEITNKELVSIWEDMEEMYMKKNADYGNSWEVELDMYGIICMNIRMYEKVNRIISITRSGAKVKDESTVDTLTDIANYCVMTGMWIINNNKALQCDSVTT